MSYFERTRARGEIEKDRRHFMTLSLGGWLVLIVLILVFVGILFLFPEWQPGWLSLGILIFVGVLVFLIERALASGTDIFVTNYRLVHRRVGWWGVKTDEPEVSAIHEVHLRQSIIQMLFKMGTLEIELKGDDPMKLPVIRRPEAFRKAINKAVHAPPAAT